MIIVNRERLFYNGVKKGGKLMKEQLQKALQHNQILDIVYFAKDKSITKRRIKLIKISGEHVQAYCFFRHAKRNFIVDNILAVHPVNKKARGLQA